MQDILFTEFHCVVPHYSPDPGIWKVVWKREQKLAPGTQLSTKSGEQEWLPFFYLQKERCPSTTGNHQLASLQYVQRP